MLPRSVPRGVLPHHYAVVLGSIKLLLLGDGDGIDVTLQLGDTQEDGGSV